MKKEVKSTLECKHTFGKWEERSQTSKGLTPESKIELILQRTCTKCGEIELKAVVLKIPEAN